MSGLILPGIATPRPNRKARLAQKAAAAQSTPNMQPRQRGLPRPVGAGIAMSPIGPMVVVQLEDNQQLPLGMTPDQAKAFAVNLISAAAHFELLKKLESDQQADNQPVPVSPEAEALLAEAVAAAGGPAGLKGDDEGEVEDDLYICADPTKTVQYNSFDINGRPCYEPPAD